MPILRGGFLKCYVRLLYSRIILHFYHISRNWRKHTDLHNRINVTRVIAGVTVRSSRSFPPWSISPIKEERAPIPTSYNISRLKSIFLILAFSPSGLGKLYRDFIYRRIEEGMANNSERVIYIAPARARNLLLIAVFSDSVGQISS